MANDPRFTVLHYLGCDEDRGGIAAVVRALATANRFDCVLGVNAGAQQRRTPVLVQREFPRVAGESLGLTTLWRTRSVAREVRAWLAGGPERIFHGHSRAGLAVAVWLAAMGERRVVVSVHCYGRRKWFYRWAARQLGERMFWLTPAMKAYYGVGDAGSWRQCVPSCAIPRVRESRLAGATGVLRLGGIGALVRWKGWGVVLEALEKLPEAVRAQVRFSHIGSAEEAKASQAFAEELRTRTAARGWEKIVTWRGEEPNSAALLRETDVLVIPSVNEPFSVAMLEALAAGVPVLAADSGGPRDVLTVGEDGWLFRTGEAQDLARAITMLVETDARDRVRFSAGKLERFSAAAVAEQWREIYARLGP